MDPLASMSSLQKAALAFLLGDDAAGRAMIDMVTEDEALGLRLPPVKHLNVRKGKVKVVVYFSDQVVRDAAVGEIVIDLPATTRAVMKWLDGDNTPLLLVGVDRIELYELPEGSK